MTAAAAKKTGNKLEFPEPSAKQWAFIRCNKRYLVYGGARGGGKSHIARWYAVLLALKFAGIKILIMRKTYPELTKNHIRPLMKILRSKNPDKKQRIAEYNKTEKTFFFPNDSTIEFQFCEREDDLGKIQGGEWDVIIIDEAEHFHELWIKEIDACVRGANDFPHQLILTANPGGPGHHYLKRIKDRRFLPDEKAENYEFIQALVTDNPYLQKLDPNYIKVLDSLPGKLKEAWRYGSFDIYEGQFFDGYIDNAAGYESGINTHVIKAKQPGSGWKYYMAYDWGSYHPWAALYFAVDYDGRAYAIHEVYGMQKGEYNRGNKWIDEKQFAEIVKVEKNHPWLRGQRIRHIADPSIWKAQNTGLSTADIAAKFGIYFEKGNNDRIPGWKQVRARLQMDDDGRPMLYIFNNCEHLRRTIILMQHDKNNPEDIDTDGEDHLMDCLRYFCMANPIKPEYELEERDPMIDPLNQYARKGRR